MDKARKMCFDKILPRDLHRPIPQPTTTVLPDGTIVTRGHRQAAVAPAKKKWLNGITIRIRFLEGTVEQIEKVKRYAPQWTKFANLTFEFTDDIDAQIRVAFNPNDGDWSYVGTDNLSIQNPHPTLNLARQDEAVILHEFGHMIGLLHEHSSGNQGIQWNEELVIKELAGRPNYWDEETVRNNVFKKYFGDHINDTEFDPDSIMLYAFPAEWTLNGFSTHENDVLSSLDRDFIRGAKMYPSAGSPDQRAIELELGRTAQAEISQPGEEDLYKLVVKQDGNHTIQTEGSIDVVMQIYGPDSITRLVAEDDNGGIGRNALIRAYLQRGTYYVHVKHASPSAQGAYGIYVRR